MKVDVTRHRNHSSSLGMDRLFRLKVDYRQSERALVLDLPGISTALAAAVGVEVKRSAGGKCLLLSLRRRLLLIPWRRWRNRRWW